jgi:hypothetical protein
MGPISNTNGTLSATQTVEGGYWLWMSCQLTVANNVVIDVVACSQNRSDSQSGSGVIMGRVARWPPRWRSR